MRIENRAPERNPRSVPVPSRSSALGNGDEARFLDRCAEGGARGIPDDHRGRQGDRVRGYLRLLNGKAESAPPAPHDGLGAGHHRPGAGRPVLPQEQRAHRRPGLVLPEHGPGIALTVSQMQMLPVPIRVRTPTKNGVTVQTSGVELAEGLLMTAGLSVNSRYEPKNSRRSDTQIPSSLNSYRTASGW